MPPKHYSAYAECQLIDYTCKHNVYNKYMIRCFLEKDFYWNLYTGWMRLSWLTKLHVIVYTHTWTCGFDTILSIKGIIHCQYTTWLHVQYISWKGWCYRSSTEK